MQTSVSRSSRDCRCGRGQRWRWNTTKSSFPGDLRRLSNQQEMIVRTPRSVKTDKTFSVFLPARVRRCLSRCLQDFQLNLNRFPISKIQPLRDHTCYDFLTFTVFLLCDWASNQPFSGDFSADPTVTGFCSLFNNFLTKKIIK